ncbi:hypothetical protein DOY81_005128 [Sarcophaga bullata]|nr:hypothetical protein DOY81_005128 [Sarcophaga bullata]
MCRKVYKKIKRNDRMEKTLKKNIQNARQHQQQDCNLKKEKHKKKKKKKSERK